MRAKSPSSRKHRQILKQAKGYRMARSKHFRAAREQLLHSGQYAFVGRRLRKRDQRREWISQINAALSSLAMTNQQPKLKYNQLIHDLKETHVELDRKILAKLSIEDPETFNFIVEHISGLDASKAA